MLRVIVSVIVLWAFSFSGEAQSSDTLVCPGCSGMEHKVFQIQNIEVRPTCSCKGACTCGGKEKKNYYSSNRFSATDDILAKSEGVSLIRRGNFAMEPNLRGLSAGQINLTIDGMKIFGACTDKMDPVSSYIEPNNLKSISISHGAKGAQVGSTIGGSVDMKINEPVVNGEKPFRGEAGVGFQSASLGFNSLLLLNYSKKKWALLANGVYRNHHNYRAGNGEKIDYSQYQKGNISLSGKILLSPNDVVRVDYLFDDAWNVGYPALPMDVAYARANIFAVTYKKYKLSERIEKWETKLYANTVNHAMDDTEREDVAIHMDMPGWTKTFGGYSDLKLNSGRHTASFRADGYHTRAKAEMTMFPVNEAPMYMLTWPDVKRNDAGFFFEYAYKIRGNSTLGINGRMEVVSSFVADDFGVQEFDVFGYDVSQSINHFLKSLNANYSLKLKEKGTFTLDAGYGERAPTVSEQYAFYIFNAYDGYDYIGKPDIETEKSAQAEVALGYNSDKFDFKATGFYYYIKDYILGEVQDKYSAMTIGANGMRLYDNIPFANITGGGLRVTYRPHENLSLTEDAQYTHGNDNNGSALPLMPPFKSITGIQYQVKKLLLQAECEAASRQNRISDEYGETSTPGYAILNIRATYAIAFGEKTLKLNTGIENLLDSDYQEHLDWGNIPRPGINWYVNVNFLF